MNKSLLGKRQNENQDSIDLEIIKEVKKDNKGRKKESKLIEDSKENDAETQTLEEEKTPANESPTGQNGPPNLGYRCLAIATDTHKVNGRWLAADLHDGIRCFWDGKELWSFKGEHLKPSKEFVKDFPKIALDGVLCKKRGVLLMNAELLNADSGFDWTKLKFIIYDAPWIDLPFKGRLEELQKIELPKGVSIELAEYETGLDSMALLKAPKNKKAGYALKDPDGEYIRGESKGFIERRFGMDWNKAKLLDCQKVNSKIVLKVRDNQSKEEVTITEGVPKDFDLNVPKNKVIIRYVTRGTFTKMAGIPLFCKLEFKLV